MFQAKVCSAHPSPGSVDLKGGCMGGNDVRVNEICVDQSQQVALYADPGQLGPERACPDSSGSNVIPRWARPGRAGLGPHALFGQHPRNRSTSLKRKHPLLVRSTHRYLAHKKTPTPWDRDRALGTVLLRMKDPKARFFLMSKASLHRTEWTTLNPDRNGRCVPPPSVDNPSSPPPPTSPPPPSSRLLHPCLHPAGS